MLSVCVSGFSVTQCPTPGDAGITAFLILPSVCKQVLVGRSTDLSTFSLVSRLHPHIDLACLFSAANNVNVREQDAASMSMPCFNFCHQIVTALSLLIGWESCHLSHVFLCFFSTCKLSTCNRATCWTSLEASASFHWTRWPTWRSSRLSTEWKRASVSSNTQPSSITTN